MTFEGAQLAGGTTEINKKGTASSKKFLGFILLNFNQISRATQFRETIGSRFAR
jgi:hypothetical protein